jgi:hypothetical protein
MTTATVWMVEKDGYPDETYVVGLFVSLDRAIAGIKERYGAPYKVTWDEPKDDGDNETIVTGHFEAVPDYSIEHTASYIIHEEPVR